MKFHSNTALPYPIIATHRDDYENSKYVVESRVKITNNEAKINLKHDITPYEIEKLVTHKNDLSFAVVVRCRSTFFKNVYFSQDIDQSITIDSLDLRDEVFIEPYIVAKRRVTVSSDDLNPEYGTNEVTYESGNVVAKALERKFVIRRDAFKPLESVFEIVKAEDLEEGDWELDAESDKLALRVSPKIHELESNLKSTEKGQSILLNSIYYAAVVEAIQILKEDDMNTKWAKVFKAKISPLGIDMKRASAYKVANILLNKPLLRLGKNLDLSEFEL